jgi:hypothetical protein
MLVQSEEYSDEESVSELLEDSVFRHCTLKDMEISGKCVDAVFLNCRLVNLKWYWGAV